MNDLPHNIPDEGNQASNQELENVETHSVSPEFASTATNVQVTATLSDDNSFITVDWHPYATYRSLTRVNQTTGAIDTLLSEHERKFPPYEDSPIASEIYYVYELFVPGNPHSPFKSPPIIRHQGR